METTTVAETCAVPEGTMLPPELKKQVDETKKKKKIGVLVAIDESDTSLYALKWALDNLFRNSVAAGATSPEELNQQDSDVITVVHVMQPFQHYVFPAGPGIYATNQLVDSVRKAQSESAAALLSRALKICKDNKHVKAETLILEGEVKEMICEAAEQMHVDLLVLGSRGLGVIKRAFLGSVSDYCVHHAKCPTLVVKPPKGFHHKEPHSHPKESHTHPKESSK